MVPLIPIAFGLLRIGLGAAAALGLGVGVVKLTKSGEEKLFNKGVCPKCGGHFKVIEQPSASSERGYKCDFCDNCVWVSFGSDNGYVYTPSRRVASK